MADDPDFDGTHRRASQAIIGELVSFKIEGTEGVVVAAMRFCKIITVNGEIWETLGSAFTATKESILQLWDQKPSAFTRFNPDATSTVSS